MSKQGPNVRKLVAHKMSLLMVPPGTGNALGAALGALTSAGKLSQYAREATLWVEAAIAVVKTAPDNPFKTDEEIAGEILRQVEAKLREQQTKRAE